MVSTGFGGVSLFLRLFIVGALLLPLRAYAQSPTTVDALVRLGEVLELRLEDGQLEADRLRPAVLVSAVALDPAHQAWFSTRAVEVLLLQLGAGSLRICEACMAPRFVTDSTGLTLQTGPVGLDEVSRLDERYRGGAEPAQVGIWLDEQRSGVSVRIVDLASGQVVFAQNVDPMLAEVKNTARIYHLSSELERRARGDGLTQSFVDIGMFPGQHLSLDWTDQWGDTNRNLSGFTLSVFDPLIGVGASHYRCVKAANMTFGGKLVLSLPTAAVRSIGDVADAGDELLDPLVTIVGVARIPFGRSNYGGLVSLSTNGRLGIGISLMNLRLFPVFP